MHREHLSQSGLNNDETRSNANSIDHARLFPRHLDGDDSETAVNISFSVAGLPKPQGSKSIMTPRGGNARLIECAGKPLKVWRELVALQASQIMSGKPAYRGAVRVALCFYLPRPQAHYRKSGELTIRAPRDHMTKPDIDKLTRAVLDSLSTRVYHDDSQVVSLLANKRYAEEDTGCDIQVISVIPETSGMYVQG